MNERQEETDRDPVHHTRMEEEIIEILNRADQSETLTDSLRRRVRQPQLHRRLRTWHWLRSRATSLSSTTMLIASFAAAIVALLISGASPLITKILAIASVALLLAPIVIGNAGPNHTTTKQWRGRDIDLRPDPPDWVGSIKDRFRRPPRH